MLLEACISSLDDALTALPHVDRLELNCALPLEGLTPSFGMIEAVLEVAIGLPVVVMCRPRAGGFVYSPSDWRVLLRDAERALELGASGVAFGVLSGSRQVDAGRCREMARLAEQSPAGIGHLTFHRAFDVCPDPAEAMEVLVDCGVARILTSGGAATAWDGRGVISDLVVRSRERIEILPGGGIGPQTVADLLRVTGCRQVHGTFSEPMPPQPGVPGTVPVPVRATSRRVLAEMRDVLAGLT